MGLISFDLFSKAKTITFRTTTTPTHTRASSSGGPKGIIRHTWTEQQSPSAEGELLPTLTTLTPLAVCGIPPVLSSPCPCAGRVAIAFIPRHFLRRCVQPTDFPFFPSRLSCFSPIPQSGISPQRPRAYLCVMSPFPAPRSTFSRSRSLHLGDTSCFLTPNLFHPKRKFLLCYNGSFSVCYDASAFLLDRIRADD